MGAMKELFMERCEEWADTINEYYGLDATVEEVAKEIWDEQAELVAKSFNSEEDRRDAFEFSFMGEIEHNSFTDTSPREEMADRIARSRTGMAMPCYGDSDEYKEEFANRMNTFNQEEL
jgi:hypothetical protein